MVGLIAKVGGSLPWAMAEELRRGVASFAASRKPTLAWAETFQAGAVGMASYALASAFDEIWLQPGGEVGLTGIAAETTFLRGALDKLGIVPELEQRREYKNAADRIMRTGFTDAHRESLTRLTESIFDDTVAAMAGGSFAGRGADPRADRHAARGPLPRRSRSGWSTGSAIATRSTRPLASGSAARPTCCSPISGDRARRLRLPARTRGHVALVEARGAIASGRSRRTPMGRSIGSDSVAAQLRAALHDDHARALVLYVDSPGGSAVASEVIWREVVRLRDAGKPVIVSMGNVAGSGGYYIACPADVIVALPTTITGSIGVFGGKFVVADLLERVGLTTGAVEHGAHARMYSPRRTFTDSERERLAASIDAIYDDFVAKVAAGRGRTVADIEPIARGRVWSGRDAVDRGLVDELGGLRDAVRIARRRAGLRDDAPVRPALHVRPLARLGQGRRTATIRGRSPAAPRVHWSTSRS